MKRSNWKRRHWIILFVVVAVGQIPYIVVAYRIRHHLTCTPTLSIKGYTCKPTR